MKTACGSKEEGQLRVERIEGWGGLRVLSFASPGKRGHAEPCIVVVTEPTVSRRELALAVGHYVISILGIHYSHREHAPICKAPKTIPKL